MTLPTTMQAVVVRQPGGPDQLEIQTVPVPAIKAGQVLIRVVAAGVNRADLLQRAGKYPPPAGASELLGLEVSGEIVATAPDVTDWRVGDTVCALLSGGGYAEYAAAEAVECLPIPAGVSVIDAAALPEAAMTVHSNLGNAARLQSGEVILIHAAASGIGTFAIQYARARGARVFGTAGSQDKLDFCKALGAEGMINYNTEEFSKVMADVTGGRGPDVIFDMLGGASTEESLETLATNGRLVIISCPQGARIQVNLVRLMQRRQSLIGTALRSRPLHEKAAIAREVRETVWPLFESGAIRPVIFQTLRLSEVAAAHEMLESRRHMGKIILTLG